jgi:hypothetical protein
MRCTSPGRITPADLPCQPAGLAVAHAVLVRQRAVEHVADDLHVAVAVGAEAGAGGDAVLVDDAQVAQPMCAGSW